VSPVNASKKGGKSVFSTTVRKCGVFAATNCNLDACGRDNTESCLTVYL
jgi:hypothetical protein